MRHRLLLPSLFTLGVLLALAATMLPTESRWSHADQARHEHVTSLGRNGEGLLHAGTQSGRLWRLQGESGWQDLSGTPGGVAITVLTMGHSGLLVGTTDGLYRWDGGWDRLLGAGRISDVRTHAAEEEGGLVVASGNRVLEQRNGGWEDTGIAEAIGDTMVYRAMIQATDTGPALHAGTVGRGVWTRLAGENRWQDNSEGLPADAKVFTLVLAGNGLLLAGTGQGLYWQTAPLQPWRSIDSGLGSKRVLDLAGHDHPNGRLLLAASDDGVYSINLVERQQSLETQGRWQRIPAESAGLDRPVSWIVPDQETVWISAGSIYRLTPSRSGLRYTGLAAGTILVCASLYMIVTGRRRG